MLEISNLTKYYGEKQALDSVSFSVADGEILGLIGKNGAGKSTILKSIAGLLNYDSGEIIYNGEKLKDNSALTQEFGILIECSFLDYINAYDNLKLLYQADNTLRSSKSVSCIDECIELVGLADVKKKRVKSFSFGMKQRLGLAQAIMTSKSFLILDEPFIGLDPIGKEIVKKVIVEKAKEGNYSVLFSSHDLPDIAEICDRIVMIDNGRCSYNGNVDRRKHYKILYSIEKMHFPEMKAEMLSIASQAGINENEISFVEENKENDLDDVIKTIYKYGGKILSIAHTENPFLNMFEDGGEDR